MHTNSGKRIAFYGILALYVLFVVLSQDSFLNTYIISIELKWTIKATCALGVFSSSFVLIGKIDNIFSFLDNAPTVKKYIYFVISLIINIGLYIIALLIIVIIAIFLAIFCRDNLPKNENIFEKIRELLQNRVFSWSEEWKAFTAILFLTMISCVLVYTSFCEYSNQNVAEFLSNAICIINILSSFSVVVSVLEMTVNHEKESK